jgi:V8-like Glu-specific endopeptidase
VQIDNPTRIQIRDAIHDAFRRIGDLQIMVSDVLDTRLEDITSLAQPMPDIVFQLVGWCEAQGRLLELLLGARRKNPGNPKLKAATATLPFVAPVTIDVEKIALAEVKFQNVGPWLSRLASSRRAVCRVEPQPPKEGLFGYGSGFLVAPDVVMTNDHVAEDFSRAGAERVRFRFDYEVGPDGVTVGDGRSASLAKDWQILNSPKDQYDFALVRLAEAVGKDRIGGSERGYLSLTSHTFTVAEPLLILQHPDGDPLQIALGSVAAPQYALNQVEYNVNTEHGSSGSPCLTSALAAVAIHQGSEKQNLGVRFDAILGFLREPAQKSRLETCGLAGLLS